METFSFDKRRIAKAVIIVFSVTFILFSLVYAFIGIVNIIKIKSAFKQTFLQISDKWYIPLKNAPFPDLENGSTYSFDLEAASDTSQKIVAIYTTDADGTGGEVNLVNADGNMATLYEVMKFISQVKNDVDYLPANYFGLKNSNFVQAVQCFGSDTLKNSDTVFGKVLTLIENDYSFPKINKKRLGYNILVLISKSNMKPGKSVSVFSDGRESKARKYTFVTDKKHIGSFVENILNDGSVENNSAVHDMSSLLFDLTNKCENGDFKVSIVVHKGRVMSIECETPKISGSAYLLSMTKNESGEKVDFNMKNISESKNIMSVNALCSGGKIHFLYSGTRPEVTADVITEKNRAKISILSKNKLNLNFMTRKEENSYDMEFYKDNRFLKPPYLNVQLRKVE